MSEMRTLLVTRFLICDDDEGVHEPDHPLDFEAADKLLQELRDENPLTSYTLIAEIEA